MQSTLKVMGATALLLPFIFSSLVHAHHGSLANNALYDTSEFQSSRARSPRSYSEIRTLEPG